MSRQIFRQAALDRLASPEQLDRPYRLVRLPAWILLGVLILAMAAGVVWACLTRAPVKVEGHGIVMQAGGMREIVADVPGRIEDLLLEPGATVSRDQTVAVFQRSEIERELARERAELADAKSRAEELADFYADNDRREQLAEDERLETISETQGFVRRRRALIEDKIRSITRLVEQKIIVSDRMIEVELELANAHERLASLDDETKQIALRRLERESRQRLALIDERLKVDQLARRVARTEARLAQERITRSAHAGQVVEIKVNRGDVVAAGTALATLMAPTGDAGEVYALIYVAPADGKRIQVGMPVEVVPSTVRREEYGFIRGEVTHVSPVPATIVGMRSILKNEQLVTRLSGEGAPFEVRVKLLKDPSTESGFKWSSSRGPATAIHAGTILQSKVVVERVPIIDLIIPGMTHMADMAHE